MANSSKIVMNPAGVIKAHLGIQKGGPVHSFFTETCYRYMDKYVPYREGNLRNEVTLTSDSITYEMPYAEYQYYAIRADGTHEVKHYTTPGTGPIWDERMVSAEFDDVVKKVQDFVNRGGK